MPLANFWWFFWQSSAFLAVYRNITLISAFLFAWCSPCVCVYVQISPFYKDTSHIRLGGPPCSSMTSSYLITLAMTLGFPRMNLWGGNTIQSTTAPFYYTNRFHDVCVILKHTWQWGFSPRLEISRSQGVKRLK